MAIDFSGLVLGPCMDTFAEDVFIRPYKSQPSTVGYTARGVWGEKPVDVQLIDGNIMSSAEKTLGLRKSEFEVIPRQGDHVESRGAVFLIEDVDEDGQGGFTLVLKEIRK